MTRLDDDIAAMVWLMLLLQVRNPTAFALAVGRVARGDEGDRP